MKNKHLKKHLLTVILFCAMSCFAQNIEVVCEGLHSITGVVYPFYSPMKYSRVESIYPDSIFPSSCYINTISYFSASRVPEQFEQLDIYMAERPDYYTSTMDWTPEYDLTLVYSGTNVTFGGLPGWHEIALDNPFYYEKEGNLVVVVSKKAVNPSPMFRYLYHVAPNQVSLLWRSATDPTAMEHPTNPAETMTDSRANMKFSVVPIEINQCRKPRSMEVLNTTLHEVQIAWIPHEDGSMWDVYIGEDVPTTATTPTATNITDTCYVFTDLCHTTQYKCFVRTNCGEGGMSSWRGGIAFTQPDFIGHGTQDYPYLLYSKTDFETINLALSKGWNSYGKHFKLMRDIYDLTEPIEGVFYGIFDGNNHTIQLDFNHADNQALFKNLSSGAYIHDLKVTGVIRGVRGGGRIAGFASSVIDDARYSDDIIIENCINETQIVLNGEEQNSLGEIGGIVGHCGGNNSRLYIIRCKNKGSIVTTGSYQSSFIGGLVGNCTNAEINQSENYCNIMGNESLGGIVGHGSNCTIMNCANFGCVTSTSSLFSFIGGIIGKSENCTIENCYNTGTIVGKSICGGVVGVNWLSTSHIRNVYNVGEIVVSSNDRNGAIIGGNTGGFIYIDGSYYLNTTYDSPFFDLGHNIIANDCSSFMQDALNPLVCTLDTMCYGSTDLRTALNNWREGNPDYREWLEDVYGYNGYFPTFDAGRPPGLEITPDPLSLGHRPIGARVRGEELRLINTGTTGLDITAVEIANASFVVLDETMWAPEMPIHLEGEQSMRVGVTTDPEAMIGEGTVEAPLVVVWDGRSATMATVRATAYVPETPDVVETALEVDSFPFTTVQGTSEIYDNYYLPGAHADGPDAVYKLAFDREMVLNAAMTTGSQPKLALYKEDFGGKGYPDVDNAYTGPAIGPGNVGPISEWLHYDNGRYVTSIASSEGQLYWGIRFPSSDLIQYQGTVLSKVQVYDADCPTILTLTIYSGGDIAPQTELISQTIEFTGAQQWVEVNLEEPLPLDVSRSLWICLYSPVSPVASACNYTGNNNSCWASFDNLTWLPITSQSLYYSWMIRGYVTNQETRQEQRINSMEAGLSNITIVPGTYYLVASSTSAEYALEINPEEIPMPLQVELMFPLDGAVEITSPTLLQWNLGDFTTEYQLLFGTTYPPREIVVDWTSALAENYRTGILQNNTQYFWKVNVRNSRGMLEGPVWGFTTTLDIPQELTAVNDKLYVGDTLELNWTPVTENRLFRGYNLYQDGVRLNTDLIIGTSYIVEGLSHSSIGYRYVVTAVYNEGESNDSNTVLVKVCGKGSIQGSVYEQDSLTGISGAKVFLYGLDELGNTQTYTIITNANGMYSDDLYAGQYNMIAYGSGYASSSYASPLIIIYSEVLSNQDILLNEMYYPVKSVQVEEMDHSIAKIEWEKTSQEILEWLYYDDGIYMSSAGTGEPFYWGVCFPDVSSYTASQLTKVAYFDAIGPGTITLNIYLGGTSSPQTLMLSQDFQVSGSDSMIEIELDTPVNIDGMLPLWITCYTNDIDYPASACSYSGDQNSCFVSFNGITWNLATQYGLRCTWMLRGFVTNEFGETVAIAGNHRSFNHFNVYRTDGYNEDYTTDNIELIATGLPDTIFLDYGWEVMEPGVYKWGVSCIYEGNRFPGESPIVWSNRLDKDMTASMGITVSLESGEDPTGTRVRLINLSEPDMGHDWDVTLDGTGCWSCSDFRKGTYTLQITRRGFHAVRIDSLSVQEDTSLSYVLAERLNGVENLHVSTTGWAQWEEQKAISQWLYYDNGQYTDAISGSTGTIWGIMIPSSDLVGYEGSALTEVAIYDGYAGTYYLSVYLGGDEAPSELVHTQTFTLEGVNDWHVKALSRPVELDTGQNLWITFYNIDASYPATACPDTGDPNGRWVSTDGVNWTDIASHGYGLTWMIRGLVSDEGRDRRSLQHFKVMLDGVFCGNVTEPYCQHEVSGMVEGSTHTTSVAAIYSTGFSEWVECEWTYTPCDQYEGVEAFNVEVINDQVLLSWEGLSARESTDGDLGGQWLYYDNGENITGVGTDPASSFYWGVMFPKSLLGGYNHHQLTKVSMFDAEAHSGTIRIYQGGDYAPLTLLHEEEYEGNGTMEYVEYSLSEALSIDATLNLWVVMNNQDGQYVASCGANTGNRNGRWISTDGVTWYDAASLGLEFTWNLRAYLEEETYSDSVLGTMVYRDGTLLTPEPMTGTTYLDATPEIGDHTYCIRVVHGNPGWPMEHDWYAMSCPKCAMVDVTGVGTHEAGQVRVYPNPSRGELTLEAEGMRRVEVSNTLGQRVYDRELRSDHHRMDMSGLTPGVYTVTVTSAIGTTVHRVVLMR